MSARVVAVTLTPVKGLRVLSREQVVLGSGGVRENRRFFLIDEQEPMVNGKRHGALQAVVADYSDSARTLSLRFPDGTVVAGAVEPGRRPAPRLLPTAPAASAVPPRWRRRW